VTDALNGQFAPEMQVYEHEQGKAWAVSFDTRSPIDRGRTSLVAFIQKMPAIKQLSVKIEGFDDGARLPEEDPDKLYITRVFAGTVSLAVERGDGTSESHTLAECRLHVLGKQRGKRVSRAERARGRENEYSFPDVQSLVRQKCADVLSGALPDFFASTTVSPDGVEHVSSHPGDALAARAGRRYTVVQGSSRRTAPSASSARWDRLKPWAAVAAVALVVWGGLAAISHRAPTPSQEARALVSAQLQQDPDAAMQQVELTKQTLASMGLDPGASGDTGCLASSPQAPPH